MKKLISLTLALLMSLCALLPAAAQAPLSLTAYRNSYNAVFADSLPGHTIDWFSKILDGEETWGARMDDVLPMVMVTVDASGNVTEVVVSYNGDLTEDDLNVFVVQSAIAGAALKKANGQTNVVLSDTVNETFTCMLASLENDQKHFTMYGVECTFGAVPANNGNYDYILIIYPNGRK